jgi:hypothetical protein
VVDAHASTLTLSIASPLGSYRSAFRNFTDLSLRSGVGPRQPLHRQLVERCPLDPCRYGLSVNTEATSLKPALEAPPAMLELVAEMYFVES